jgi:hypothetical protein
VIEKRKGEITLVARRGLKEARNTRPGVSADGPLAYSRSKPPVRDYFFQYTWILPGIFNPQVNLREHRYFGSPLKDSARFLFDF